MGAGDGGILSDISIWEIALLAFGLLLTLLMAVFIGVVLYRAGRED